MLTLLVELILSKQTDDTITTNTTALLSSVISYSCPKSCLAFLETDSMSSPDLWRLCLTRLPRQEFEKELVESRKIR